MHEWLTVVAEPAIVLINFLALLIMVLASLEAFIAGLRVRLRSGSGEELRRVWLSYGRWLVAFPRP